MTGVQPDMQFEERGLFISGEDGYHTYRIPALVVSQKGTVLAFCEGRKYGRSDAGKIDLVLKRSTDVRAGEGDQRFRQSGNGNVN